MKTWVKWGGFLLLCLPIAALAAWYSFSFLPHLNELKSISVRGEQTLKVANSQFYSLAQADNSNKQIRTYAVRQAVFSLVAKPETHWTATNVLWYGASFVHFSDQEMFAIWVQCALTSCDKGSEYISDHQFGKTIGQLSTNELASLVAFVRCGNGCPPGSDKNRQRTKIILDKYEKKVAAL